MANGARQDGRPEYVPGPPAWVPPALGAGLWVAVLLLSGCAALKPASDGVDYLAASRAIRSRSIAWEPVSELTFADTNDLSHYEPVEGRWAIVGGTLIAAGGDRNRAILLTHDAPGPVRVEADVTLYPVSLGRIGDITVLMGATADAAFFKSGYALTTGSYWNHCSTFYRLGRPMARTEYSPLAPGTRYRVAAERIDGHLRLWLNDEIVLEAWDPDPLAGDPERRLGLRTWDTRMVVERVTVYRETQRGGT